MLHSNTICEEGEKSTGSATRAHPSRAAPSHPAGQHVTICGAESMGAGVDDTFLKARSVLFSSKNPSQPLPPKHQRRQHKAKHTGFGLLGAGAKQQFSASRKHPCILLDPLKSHQKAGHTWNVPPAVPSMASWHGSRVLGGERRIFLSRNATLSPVQARPYTPGHGAACSMAQGCHPTDTGSLGQGVMPCRPVQTPSSEHTECLQLEVAGSVQERRIKAL